MWIVRLALRRPYTFVVAALLLVLLTPFILLRTPTDIFPAINIPVISIIWQYTGPGRPGDRTAHRVHPGARAERHRQRHRAHRVHFLQRHRGHQGVLAAGASVQAAVAQITAIAQTVLRQMPPGTTPPLIIQYNASTVPILQYSFSSPKMSEQEFFDVTANQVRIGLSTMRGA